MALLAGKYDMVIQQGDVFQLPLKWVDLAGSPVDLTGYTAAMKIKPIIGGAEIASLTSGAELTLGDAAGTIVIDLTATVTAGYSFLRAKYDIELYPAGVEANAVRIGEGKVTLSKEVTTS